MTNHGDIVRQAVESFDPPLRAGQGDEQADEEMKALATRRAAYLISLVDPNVGLVFKDTGNQVLQLSTDLLLDRATGEAADCMSTRDRGDGTREVVPQWLPLQANADPAWLARWRPPTRALAGLDAGPPVVTAPDPAPAATLLQEMEARLLAHQNACTQQVVDKLTAIQAQFHGAFEAVGGPSVLQELLAALLAGRKPPIPK